MTEKTKIDEAPAIASTLHKPQPVMQFTGGIADNVEDNFPMLLPTTMIPMMMPTTVNDKRTMKTMLCPHDQSTATAYTLNNSPPLMQPTVEFANDVEDDFELMIPTMPMTATSLTSPTPLPDYYISDSNMTNLTTYHRTTTIHWVSDTFALVFKALDRLEIEIANLYDSVVAATSNLCTIDPPMPPTLNLQPHCLQP